MTRSLATSLLLTVSVVIAAASGFVRFGIAVRHPGVWIDLVFLTSTALAAALTMGMLIERMRRAVRGECGSTNHPIQSNPPQDTSGI